MPATKIFLTGATGFIGGDALYTLTRAHPEFSYTLLVRNEERGRQVLASYPSVRLVYGDLNNEDLIAREAAAADIVIHTGGSADDVPSAKAIAKGLADGHTAERPGYWLHVSGAGLLMHYDVSLARYGEVPAPGEIYNDIDDIERILSHPDEAMHRNVDKLVQAANGDAVRTLIVSPPCIYGVGRGPGNKRSLQVEWLASVALKDSKGTVPADNLGPGPGLAQWDHVHIADLSAFFVLAVEAALDPARNSNPEIFGPRAYFFVEAGVHTWRKVADWIAESIARVRYVDVDGDAKSKPRMEIPGMFYALNSRSVAARARKYLGWEPKAPGLKESIDSIVKNEAEALGKKKVA